jgi:phospholipid/cholesterol/gamma-HCH transport system substrate-binding protein
MGRSVVETLMGAIVIFVALSFLFISYKSGNIAQNSDGYKVTAKFREIGSLAVGSDVRVGGIKVGTVFGESLDSQSYSAIIELNIKNDVKLPKDSSVSIVGDGLLGGKYVSIQPGGDSNFLENGGEIKFTQDSISIEELIGKFAFGGVK